MPGPRSPVLLLALQALVLLSPPGDLYQRGASACGFQDQGCSAGRERRDIVFPGEEEDDPITRFLTPEQIEHLNNLELEEVVGPSVEPPVLAAKTFSLASRIGGGSEPVARSPMIEKAVAAKCQPTLQPVPLKKPDDLSVMYWPYCIQLERCSGCCINDRQQSCQPTQIELVPFKVSRYLINGMIKNGSEILHLEKHKSCACSCIVKAEHCNALQNYSNRECRCNCGNADEKRKCLSQSNKIWDHNECRCLCRQFPTEVCTTGLEFDVNTCTCKAITAGRHKPDNTYKLGDDKRRRRWRNRTSTMSPTLLPLS